jgi:3-hydroxybutyryl-CoA dehydrogenase
MQIAVYAHDFQWNALKSTITAISIERAVNIDALKQLNADLFFYLKEDVETIDFSFTNKPIIINSTTKTLQQLNSPKTVLRINGWQTFIERNVWEIAGSINNTITALLSSLQKKLIEVPDEIGFTSAKVVSMIINEAYFALEENVSTKEEIDIAMKLGTNYPYGPFDWASKIGVSNVYNLLNQLSIQDKRYTPCTILKNEAFL